MVFYEDFIRKIEEDQSENKKERYSFGANYNKLLSNIGIAVPLILLGLLEMYTMSINGFSSRVIIAILILIYGIYIFYNVVFYKIVIDIVGYSLKDKKININLKEINLCELRRMVAPGRKSLDACLVFYTEDKKEIILPLIMRRKLEFVIVVKNILGETFKIIEEK